MSENEQKAGCVDADGNPCFPIDPGPLWSDLKGRLEKVAAGLQFNRETHVVWRDWLEKSPDNEKVNPHGGNAKFHADTVLEYDGHIGTVHDTISAIATLSPARSGEAVAGLVKRWREAADWLDSFGDNPTMRSRAEGFRVCADALEELT